MDDEIKHGVLQVPESHGPVDHRTYFIFYSENTDHFFVEPQYADMTPEMFASRYFDDRGIELTYINTICAKDRIEADMRCAETELWHHDR